MIILSRQLSQVQQLLFKRLSGLPWRLGHVPPTVLSLSLSTFLVSQELGFKAKAVNAVVLPLIFLVLTDAY